MVARSTRQNGVTLGSSFPAGLRENQIIDSLYRGYIGSFGTLIEQMLSVVETKFKSQLNKEGLTIRHRARRPERPVSKVVSHDSNQASYRLRNCWPLLLSS